MNNLRKPLLLLLCLSSAIAAPVFNPNALLPRHESRIIARQDKIDQPVSFQTVTTTETQVGSITQTCDVTLTPITGQDGAELVREDKSCTFVVVPTGGSAPPPPDNNNNNGSDNNNGAPPPDQTTATDGQATTTAGDPNATTTSASFDTATFATSVVGTATDVPGAAQSSGATTSADASATASAPPPAISVIGPGSIPADSTGAAAPSTAETTNSAATPTTTGTPVVSTQSDGSVVTLTPSQAQAQESSSTEEVPGRKLEVLPIGLGVFAGISVIALIVVGLVTYERTKYRKAFRQRKLAEAGASMGYGGMAERS